MFRNLILGAAMTTSATMIAGNCDNCSWTTTTMSTVAQCYANGEAWVERGMICHANKWERVPVNCPVTPTR